MVESLLLRLENFRQNFTGALLELDKEVLPFSETSVLILNIAVGFLMFSVALDIKWEQFKHVFKAPKAATVGLICQFVLLPLFAFLFMWIAGTWVTAGVAFGVILIASCPGGNASNFINSLANGNTALAVTLSAIGTMMAIVMTPFNFKFYGDLYEKHSAYNVTLVIDAIEITKLVLILLGVPIVIGILVAYYYPNFVAKIKKPIKIVSLIIFTAIVVINFASNYDIFIRYIKLMFFIVLLLNSGALLFSYWLSRASKLSIKDSRTLSIETGVQNSALALALIYGGKVFPEGMATGALGYIAAWFAVWQMLAGTALAFYWRKKPAQ